MAGLYFTLREKAKSAAETIREFNVQVQEQNEKISEAKNKANSYISTMFDTSKAVDAIARQPEAEPKIKVNLVLGCALAEATAIYGFVIALLIILMLH